MIFFNIQYNNYITLFDYTQLSRYKDTNSIIFIDYETLKVSFGNIITYFYL